MFGAAAAPAPGGLFGASAGGANMFGGAAPAAAPAAADEDDAAAIVNEDDHDDEPTAPALNDNEVVGIEMRCKAFVWDSTAKAWSGRGTHVARVITNTQDKYSSLLIKHEQAPFKVLGQVGDSTGLNCKLSESVASMMKPAGKTLTVILPDGDGIVKYLLRFKGDKECAEVMAKIKAGC
eukprot:TRINITY_DN39046_c0_g1_i1.p1 TRINITY_DN39046_c0_g1~~TRINITY_DN39046_c0_g1_i1.p1  ORF type:complete len:179 (+),score=65.19 TRINITY_DN39046_c0_g1_i1:104-640(+)